MKPTLQQWLSFFLIISVLVGCKEKQSVTPDAAEKQSVPKKAEPSANKPFSIYQWPTTLQGFRLNINSDLSSQSGAAFISFSLQADVGIIPQMQKNATTLSIVLHEVQLQLKGNADEEKIQQLTAELSRMAQGVYKNGILQKVLFPTESTTFAVGIWRTIFSYLQMADSRTGDNTFKTTEYDSNGKYIAQYEPLSTEPGSWQKRKLEYVNGLIGNHSALLSEGVPQPRLLSFKEKIQLEKGVLQSIFAQNKLEVSLTGSGRLISVTDFHLKSQPLPTEFSQLFQNAVSQMMVLRADEPFAPQLPIDAMDSQRMQGLTFDSVVEALIEKAQDPKRKEMIASQKVMDTDGSVHTKEASESTQKWTLDWSRYFSALPAFFRQEPKTILKAASLIRSGSPAGRSLLGGLSSSGVPEAQQLLLRLAVDEHLDISIREAAIRNLVQCKLPTPEIAAAVQNLVHHELLSRYAVFGIGIYCRKFREEGNHELSKKLVHWLLDLLQKETDIKRRRDILRGISNAADGSLTNEMIRLLSSAEASDRAGALEALRLVSDPQVDELLARHMSEATESAPAVRRVAIATSARRDAQNPLLAALIDTAKNDSDKRVKKEARKILFGWSREMPKLKDTLEQIAQSEEVTE